MLFQKNSSRTRPTTTPTFRSSCIRRTRPRVFPTRTSSTLWITPWWSPVYGWSWTQSFQTPESVTPSSKTPSNTLPRSNSHTTSPLSMKSAISGLYWRWLSGASTAYLLYSLAGSSGNIIRARRSTSNSESAGSCGSSMTISTSLGGRGCRIKMALRKRKRYYYWRLRVKWREKSCYRMRREEKV